MEVIGNLLTIGNLIIFLGGFFLGCYVCHERFRGGVNKVVREIVKSASRVEMKGVRKDKDKNGNSRKDR